MKNISYISSIILLNLGATLTPSDIHKIGLAIWQNEGSRKKENLAFWSEREPFPSLGICHAIWYPEGYTDRFTQQFPDLCSYLEKHKVKLPAWLKKAKNKGAPWKTRKEFMADTKKRKELIDLLYKTIDLQTRYTIMRMAPKVDHIIKAAPADKKAIVKRNVELLKSTLIGTYALVDYLNFKGDGLNPEEEINGVRWGLAQVLYRMPDNLTQENVHRAFASAAAYTLSRLVLFSQPDFTRMRALPGWIKRVHTYADPETLSRSS